MEARREHIERFLRTCKELIEGKFITADTKISELLAGIAASKELTELFTAVTQGFDYGEAKRTYLRFPASRGAAHGVAYLPSDRAELLAFVFCLFVELDAGTLQFGDFLLRYFYVDGSYTASYLVFTERVVRPFTDIVRDCFPAVGRNRSEEFGREQEDIFDGIEMRLPAEHTRLTRYILPEEARAAVELIHAGLASAVGRRDVTETAALLAGYRYFLRSIGGEDASSDEIFLLASKL